MSSKSIIVNPTVLAEDFIPPYIKEREHHIKWLMSTLFPTIRGRKSVNAWIHGNPGTGKTCISKFVIKKLGERWGNFRGIYVNCWNNPTLFSILDSVMKELRLLGGEAPSTTVKLERFLNAMKNKPLVLILDEIDIPSPKERNKILYNLSRNGNVGIICISRLQEAYDTLDERVKSRLSVRILQFEEYTRDQVMCILKERATKALQVGSWQENVLELIADLANGDVRVAIASLKSASELAESEGTKIALDHIYKGVRSIKESKQQCIFKELTPHHRLIYNIIQQKPNILSGELWDSYVDVCTKTNFSPIARRTFSAYLTRMEEMQLITSEKAPMGKVRSFRTVQ